MEFNFTAMLDSLIGFFGFMSRAYGTGNLVVDGAILGFACVLAVLIVSGMQVFGFTRNGAGSDIAMLEDVTELLNELNLQVTEMHGSVVHEFHRCRGELGAIRQDLVDLKTTIQSRPYSSPAVANGSQKSKRPTFYGGKRNDLSGLRGVSS